MLDANVRYIYKPQLWRYYEYIKAVTEEDNGRHSALHGFPPELDPAGV